MKLIEAQVLKRLQAYQSDAPGPETFCSSRAITKKLAAHRTLRNSSALLGWLNKVGAGLCEDALRWVGNALGNIAPLCASFPVEG
jgi:hypothetical protein